MSWLHDQTTETLTRVKRARELGVFPYFRPFRNLGPRVAIGDRSYINYSSNDYLGLSQTSKLTAATVQGVRRFGTGLGSARPQATSVRHLLLERRLAAWLGYSGCAVFTTGYQALVGTLQAFLDDKTSVVFDKLSHASIIDGLLLAKGQHEDLEMSSFKHNDAASLDKALAGASHPKKLVIVEGLYSVDGDRAPLSDVLAVARRHGAVVMLDDAHGIGTLGPGGRGVAEAEGVQGEVDLLIGTFSKAFGAVGGFLCADSALVEYVTLSARSYLFSASLPVAEVEAALAALDIIREDVALRGRLRHNGRYFRERLVAAGFNLGQSNAHITPIFLGNEELTIKFAAALFEHAGIIMVPFVAPGVPRGKERLRCNVTAVHTEAQMNYTVSVLEEVGRALGVLTGTSSVRVSRLERMRWYLQNRVEGLCNVALPRVRYGVRQWPRRLANRLMKAE